MIKACEHKACCNFFSITSGRQKFKRFCSIICKKRNHDANSERRKINARKRWHANPNIQKRSNELKSIRYHAMTDEEKRAVNKKRNEKYKAYRLARHYERMKSDIHYMVRQKISDRIRKALKAGYGNKSKSCLNYIGCSVPHLRQHLEAQFSKGMTWDNYGEWHIDHIKPCAAFDLTCEEQQSKCFNYTNLQPLWAIDNLKKGAKYNET